MSMRPLPGRPVPFTYTASEAQRFINSRDHDNDDVLQAFLESGGDPPWGVIIYGETGNRAGEFLVWRDASDRYQVVDVTGHPIATDVAKPDYHTDDESILHNMVQRTIEITEAGMQGLAAGLPFVFPALILGGAWLLGQRKNP